MKRILNIILTLILVLVFAFPTAAQKNDVLSFGRISVVMPEIKVEIKGSGYSIDQITANLESEKLSVMDAAKYDNSANSSCAYILVDLSTSMRTSFNLVKKNIVTYINSMSDNDKLVLLTFGKNEVKTVLNGKENKAQAINVVNKLNCNEGGTLFYEALSKAYQLSNSASSEYDREYVIAFSDGIDVQRGSTTFEEVEELYDSHALPLYAACSYNASKAAADKFGELARKSGGNISIIKDEKIFGNFLNEINDVTIVKFKAKTNRADGKEKQLSVKVGSSQLEYNVPIVRSIPDNTPPAVKDLYYDIEKDSFIISFSEEVAGAATANAYKITDAKGNGVAVSEVFYSEKENIYEIKTGDALYKGNYTFEFSGIKDNSQESNALSGKKVVKIEKAKSRGDFSIALIAVVAVVCILVVGIIVVLIVLSTKKKDSEISGNSANVPVNGGLSEMEHYQPRQEEIKHHIKMDDSVRLRLNIKTGRTSEQNIEMNIVSSIIVGRSNACDICIDDAKLSRQHFVIENDGGNIYITDLQSHNGTMLNGIRINSRQSIKTGDKILAGLSDIVVTVIGR